MNDQDNMDTGPVPVSVPQPVAATYHVAEPARQFDHHDSRPAVKQGRDKAVYVRQQKGHSLTKHLLFGWIVLWIPAIYYTASPNHYWHA